MKDDQGREWAGNKKRQVFLANRLTREAKLSREHPVDIAGAVGTIAANLICDCATDLENALEGLKRHYEDMQVTVRERFGTRGKAN